MAENVEDKLKTLKNTLQTTEGIIESKTKEKNTLKGDIANLEKIVKEINQLSDAYKQGLTVIQKDETEIESYISLKEPMIETAIKDKKEDFDSTIKGFDDSIDTIQKEVDSLREAVENAQKEYEGAKEKRDMSQNEYNSFKAKQKVIENNLKTLKDLKKRIEQEEDDKDTANMYFFLQESKKLLDATKTDILSEKDFKNKLLEEWAKLDADEMSARTKELSVEVAKNKLNEKQKALETARKERNQHILEKLKTI
ncbi:MAG: hypothetical protein HRU72_09650 [Planctomycetia bacterium]|uniref:Uncharacterized protein n=1 Tax=Candidatus Brocadia sapporoensis TaxID=392547 RepID=A0A1V6LWZ6_9BACT|nr:hypothetical protein [Candidatus Brocadia sapporoensis]MDG6006191.1 hypothetical protein [Candidatus Brocadia sp.]QOJ06782.1 MAG: hypothetical protein HRU72_09650 [Planctomycetia bacterium]TVL96173.1 MAG: hypothetical protein CV082_07995 [Candidatus Brocadia sp. BL1]OQD44662.1 hypothetical protein BIY37_12485 [Candidatus Brocadia sapporoensis]GJQ22234.1 MAG: hypothetical protein HBSAPP01_00240 [Candidatus Brocadia sapporoensis]